MLDWLARELNVSTTVAGMLLVIVATQIAVQAYALVDLARRRRVRGGRKWVWAIAIVLGNLVGALGYLFAGRDEPEVHDVDNDSDASTAGGDAARNAVDTLYGSREPRSRAP